jgi:hypothetical protein
MSSKTTTTRSRTAVTMRREAASGVEPEGGAEAAAGASAPAAPPCAFPLEMDHGRCPVAVFNAPDAPNTRIAHSDRRGARPTQFRRGLLAVFTEREADIVRNAARGNNYVEANPRLGDEPLICDDCYPKTRWYSQNAYQRHVRRFHSV